MNTQVLFVVTMMVVTLPCRADWSVGFNDAEAAAIYYAEVPGYINPIITNQPDPLSYYAGAPDANYEVNTGFQPSSGALLNYTAVGFPDRPSRSPWTITASASADNVLVMTASGANLNQMFYGVKQADDSVEYFEQPLVYNLAFSALSRPALPVEKQGRGGDILAVTGERIKITYSYSNPASYEDSFQVQLPADSDVFFAYNNGAEGSDASAGVLLRELDGTQEAPLYSFSMNQGDSSLGFRALSALNLSLSNGFDGQNQIGNAVSFQIEYTFDFTWLNSLQEFIWEGAEGFTFSKPENWSRNMSPGFYDTVQFSGAGLKTIEFTAADYVQNKKLFANVGSQTDIDLNGSAWELGGHGAEEYELERVTLNGSSMTITDGTLRASNGNIFLNTSVGNSYLGVEEGGRIILPNDGISVGMGGGNFEATLSVDGVNSYVEASLLKVGDEGRGSLLIANQGLVYASNKLYVGLDAIGEATVTGVGSRLLVAGDASVDIGTNAKGTMTVENGAEVVFGDGTAVRLGLGETEGYLSVRGPGSGALQGNYTVGLNGLLLVSEGGGVYGQNLDVNGGTAIFQSEAIGNLRDVVISPDLEVNRRGFLTVEGGASLTMETLFLRISHMQVADGGRVEVLGTPGATEFTGANTVALVGGSLEVGEGSVFKTPLLFVRLGTLRGRGKIEGNVVNDGGIVEPGQSPGVLTIDGDFTQTDGTLKLEIGGAIAGEFYDQLFVTGDLRIEGGVIEFAFVNGFAPKTGQMFTFFDVGGTFTSSAEFAVSGLENGWQYVTAFDPVTGSFTLTSLNDGVASSAIALPTLSNVSIIPASVSRAASISATITGAPIGTMIFLEASSDLGVTDTWETIQSIPVDANGSAVISNVIDPGSIGLPSNFFRLRVP